MMTLAFSAQQVAQSCLHVYRLVEDYLLNQTCATEQINEQRDWIVWKVQGVKPKLSDNVRGLQNLP